jgi:hypothetical protein
VLSISAAHLVQQRKAVRELALTHNSNALSCLATETAQMREQDLSCHGELPTQESSSVTVLLFGIIMLGVTSVRAPCFSCVSVCCLPCFNPVLV